MGVALGSPRTWQRPYRHSSVLRTVRGPHLLPRPSPMGKRGWGAGVGAESHWSLHTQLHARPASLVQRPGSHLASQKGCHPSRHPKGRVAGPPPQSQAEPQAAPETPPPCRVHFPEGRVPGQLSFLSPGIWTGLSLGLGKEPRRVSCCPSGSTLTCQPEEGLRPEVQVTGELAFHGNGEAPAPNWAGHK